MDLPSLLEEFRAEALDHVRAFEEELLKLERAPSDPQPVRRMFLAVHTIKGGAAMLNRTELRDLSHAMEDTLGAIRDGAIRNGTIRDGAIHDGKRTFDRPTADLLFRGADLLRALILGGSDESFREAIAELEAELLQRAAASEAAVPRSTESPRNESRRRALVVDDSPVVRMIEKALLEGAEYEVETVEDGQEALQKLQQETFALLVTGIETRGLGGVDLARAARTSSTSPNLAIILVTSGETSLPGEQGNDLGLTAILRKGQDGQKELLEVARALSAMDSI